MWDIPKYRIRAYLRSVRSHRRREREKSRDPGLHFRRVRVELRLPDDFGAATRVVPAKAILNDLTPKGLKVFTPVALEPGTELAITIQAPQYFFIRARVMFCHELGYDPRVLTATPSRYRVGLTFSFQSLGEEAAVESYVEQVFNEHVAPGRDQ
jgi:hypothetical protein